MGKKLLVVVVAIFFFVPFSVALLWNGKQDNKSVAELELMSDTESR